MIRASSTINPDVLELASGRCPDCGGPVDFGPAKVDLSEPGERWLTLHGRCLRCESRWRVDLPQLLRGHCSCGNPATHSKKTVCLACYTRRRRDAACSAIPGAAS